MKIISGRFQRNEQADWKFPLDSSESIIVTAIESYFMLPWSRHYAKADEGQYAVRILSLIHTAIKDGHIPLNYNLASHVPSELFLSNQFISRTIIEAYFGRISNYLVEKRMKPDGVRNKMYGGKVVRKRIQ